MAMTDVEQVSQVEEGENGLSPVPAGQNAQWCVCSGVPWVPVGIDRNLSFSDLKS